MKKIVLFLCLMVAGLFMSAQSSESVTIDLAKLTPEVQAQVKEQLAIDATTKKIESYGKWVGVGKEIGVAVKDGLTAVKDVTVELSETKIGKVTIWLIVYKVIGKDVLRIGIGGMFWTILTILFIWSFRRTCLPRRVCIENPGLFSRGTKKYQVIDVDERYIKNPNRMLAHFAFWAIMSGITALIMFA